MTQKTLIDVLRDNSELKQGITFIEQGGHEEFMSYPELYQLSLKGLCFLQQSGLKPKDELVFQVEENRTFIILFWSCILGGIIPVPLSIGKNDDQKAKLYNVWEVLINPYIACTNDHLTKVAQYGLTSSKGQLYARIRSKFVDLERFLLSKENGVVQKVKPSDLAFIQFSSGSTGSPKGVELTHENLITNVAAIANAAGYASVDSTLSWMPLTHDMGLIGFHINPLFSKMGQYIMPTGVFVRSPTLWLSKTTEHKATVICSPNFGYRYLLKYMDTSKAYDWDLSSVRIIYNGAEPISETLGISFLNSLARYGLRKNTMSPVYGLAEASLAVSMSDMTAEIISVSLDRNQLNVGCGISKTDSENALSFVNVGKAINDVEISITDTTGTGVKDEVIGHVKIKGKNVTSGYYNNPEATERAISSDGWLDTGDLGFIKEGTLYITGRAKDIFFINGQNYYPHDLERIAEEVEGIELNKIIISGTQTSSDTVLAFVSQRGSINSFLPIVASLKAHINKHTGVDLRHVIPVRDIPKTTSGKLQRFKLVEKYNAGEYNQVIEEIEQAEKSAANLNGEQNLPQNETEGALLNMWQKLFKDQQISITDNFFEIGGNSLKAAEFAMMVLKEYEVELPLADLYDHQSVQALAIILNTLKKSEYLPVQRAAIDSRQYPISALQKRLFYFQETHQSSTAYNVPVAFKIKSVVDTELLGGCIGKLMERHEILKASFSRQGADVFVKIREQLDVPFTIVKADPSASGIAESFIQPFNLTESSLFRVFLIENKVGESVLLFDFHHVIIDGVSASYFIEELLELYEGRGLGEVPGSYADFAYWSENLLKSDSGSLQKQYWLKELGGELPQLEMPLDKPRPAQFDHAGSRLAFKIGKVKSEKLRALSAKYNCSMHALMFAFYSILLHKYTGQKELIIGIPVTSRNHPDIRQTLGMFVNNLAIRVQLNAHESFENHLIKLIEVINKALLNDYPFNELVEDLEVKRDMSRNLVFDTMFLYQNMGLPSSLSDLLEPEPINIDPGTAKFDISQEVFDNGSGAIAYNLEYAQTLFNQSSIQKLAGHFDTLLDRVLINPKVRIADISLLSIEEYQNQVFEFNDTVKKYTGLTVLDSIHEQVANAGGRVSISQHDHHVSYNELSAKSDTVAAELLTAGIKKGDIVALHLERSEELIISMLGIMKSGGVYLPIDTDLPIKRVQYLISHSQCKKVITAEHCKEQLLETVASDVEVLISTELLNGSQNDLTFPQIDGDDLAYVLYTSGTTGNPKGVKVSHRALHNYTSWAATEYVGSGSGSFPLFTSISFDLTLTSIFTPLSTGHTIVIYNEEGQEASHPVIRAIRDDKVDIIKLTPSHLRLLRSVDLSNLKKTRLQKMIVGGESLDMNLANDLNDIFDGQVSILNEYGPTEATVGCMIYQFKPEDLSPTVPIGVPAANTEIYLLDDALQPVPKGVTGGLYVAGRGLACGYLFDDLRTSEKFIPNPFRENERMYKTGDLARRLSNGTLEYLGRADEQMKVNGYRVESGEVNHHLCAYPGIIDAVVDVHEVNKSESLFAWLLINKGEALPGETQLKIFLAERLPFYMIPSRIISLEEFPVTGNGKIDREALAVLAAEKGQKEPKLPENELERLFAATWKRVLAVENIALDDNFFELGGDSIKAIQVVSYLHEQMISVQVKDILTYSTIEQLIVNKKFSMLGQKADQRIVSGIKPKTPIESWFFNQEFTNPAYFNQSVVLTVNRPLNVDLLQKAFELLISHHDGLRINYDKAKDSLFFNNEHLESEFIIPEIPKEADFTSQLVGLKSSFDLEESLLIKAAIFKEAGEQKYLFITAQHLITDGLSWRILLHDLSAVYNSFKEGKEHILPGKTASLIQWQKALTSWKPENEGVSNAYWQEVGACPFELPKVSNINTGTGKMKSHQVSLQEVNTTYLIKEAYKPYQTDVFTLLNVVLARVLYNWTGSNTMVIEHENHGRHLNNCDVSRTLGWFTSMYPVKLELIEKDSREQIKAIKEQLKNVPQYGLYYGLSAPKQAGHSEVRFNYLGEFVLENTENWSFSGISTGAEIATENQPTTRLDINAMVMNGFLSIELTYNDHDFTEKMIQDLGAGFLNELNLIIDEIKGESDIHFTPSDFEASLDQQELDELFT